MNKIIYLFILNTLCLPCLGQKTFYATGEKGWLSENKPDSLNLSYSVFLAGNTESYEKKAENEGLKLLSLHIKLAKKNDILLFLGNNIPDPRKLNLADSNYTQPLSLAQQFNGKAFFIPGNMDWKKGKEGLLKQADFIEKSLERADFLPQKACAGPLEIHFNDNLVILFIDSQWWLNKKKDKTSCITEQEIIKKIRSVISGNKNRHIILAQHHPIYSNGKHGGYFTLKDHLFPLTRINKNLYVPLPLIGSAYPILRHHGISKQDIPNRHYQKFINTIISAISNSKNLIIASSHENILQFTKNKYINQVISGSIVKADKVFNDSLALFGSGQNGFAKLNYYTNGQCWIEFWTTHETDDYGTLVYRKPIYGLPSNKSDLAKEKATDYSDSVKLIAAGKEYKASVLKNRAFGKHYRESWTKPVHLNYLDLTRYKGEIKPINASENSLVLRDNSNKFYTFTRLNNDEAYDLLPSGFDATIAKDILHDQTSTSHPFGAVVVDKLAENAGLFHRNSKIFYLPNTRLLEDNLAEFGGKAGVLENFTDEKELFSTEDMYNKLQTDHDVKVNQHEFLKLRLFDLLIGDYSRGESEWLWEKRENYFYPIPKIRKQYFTKINGIIPPVLKNLVPEIQHFDYTIKKPEKLSVAARNLDRNLLNELTEEDWIMTAKDLQQKLSDPIIENAVKLFPKELYDIDGAEITQKLISRKNEIDKVALKYYRVLSEKVKLTATDNNDIITINRYKEYTIVNIKDNYEKTVYSRKFDNKRTKEIQIYSLNGIDSLTVTGISDSPIKIRFIGGEGKDILVNKSGNRDLRYYDSKESSFSGEVKPKIILSDKRWVNDYNRNDFKYNIAGFTPTANIYNVKDLISIGISHTIKKRGFRKEPYAFEQNIAGLIAPKSGALELKYYSTFYSLFYHKFDLVLDGRYLGPAYYFNYYGEGNNSANNADIDFYRVRSKTFYMNTYFQYRFSDKIKAGIGPGIEYANLLKRNELNYMDDVGIKNPAYDWFFKLSSYFDIDYRDNRFVPQNGWRLSSNITYNNQLTNNRLNHVRLSADFSTYYTPSPVFPLTLAIRIGAGTNIGDYQFYHANAIGNYDKLRGFYAQRFSGRSAGYGNSEVRLPIAKLRNYFISGDFGVFGFYDVGKVKSDKKESNNWHHGYGPGIWVNLFDSLILSLGYGMSRESQVFSFNTGFRF